MKKILLTLLLFTAVLSFSTSLYTSSSNSRFQNIITPAKASRVGDTVTIVVFESPRVATNSQTNSLLGAVFNAINTGTKLVGVDLQKIVPVDTKKTQDKTDNKSSATAVLELTATVTKVDQFSRLFVEGKKQIKVGNDLRELIVTGWVHPDKIGPNNVVNSTELADAQIWENGKVVFQDDPKESTWLGLILSSLAGLFK